MSENNMKPVIPHSKKAGAFTLIEVLVAIAIIAVLAAILASVLTGAIRSAKISTCANNLKQIQAGLTMYVNDNNGTFPPVALINGYPIKETLNPKVPPSAYYYRLLMHAYGVSDALYKCPLNELYGTKASLNIPLASHVLEYSTYISVCWLPYRMTHKTYPWSSNVDTASTFSFTDIMIPPHAWPSRPDDPTLRSAHGTSMNYAFLDGHVKQLPCSYFWGHNPKF